MAHLQEVLVGPQGVKYGPQPKIALPGDDEKMLRFAINLLEVLKEKRIYRRDNVVVYPYGAKGRLEIMTAQALRTFIDEHVACYKQKFDNKGDPYDVVRSVNRETAQGVLECFQFWSGLPEIDACNSERSISIDEDTGEMTLLEPGYDQKTKTLTFE